jgi:site-specific DNA recombinase
MAEKLKSAVIYSRLSEIGVDGSHTAGLDRQEADCREYAKMHNFNVIEVYREEGVSAYSGRVRPRFQHLIRDLAIGNINEVLVWRLDRLARRSRDLETFIDAATANNVTLHTVQDKRPHTPQDSYVIPRLVAVMAGEESRSIGVRVARAKEERAKAGSHTGGGPRPFGWTDGSKTKQVLPEKKLYLELARRFVAGETCHAIAVDWNARKIKNTQGGGWSSPQLYNILRSPRYAGKVLYQRRSKAPRTFPAQWKPFIDERTWEAIQAEMRVRSQQPKNGGFHGRKHLLSGFLHCGGCGYKLLAWKGRVSTATRKGRGPVYWCQKRTEHPEACGTSRIRMQDADAAIAGLAIEAIKDPAVTSSISAGTSSSATAKRQVRIAEIEDRLEDLERRLLKGELEENMAYRKAVAELRSERDTLSLEAAGHRFVSATRGRSLRSIADWKKLSLSDQRQVLASLLEAVLVAPGGVRAAILPRLRPIFITQPVKPLRVMGRLMLASARAKSLPPQKRRRGSRAR